MDSNSFFNSTQVPTKYYSIASLVLGLFSLLPLIPNSSLPTVSIPGGLIFGIVGIVLASTAKKRGNTSGIRTAGQILSIIGVVIHSISLASCLGAVSCFSCVLCTGAASVAGILGMM